MSDVSIRNVELTLGSGAARTPALRNVDLDIEAGIFTVVAGPSGSGKTSLLSILGAMITPDKGSVRIAGVDIVASTDEHRAVFRREKVGFVFQSFRLIPALTAEENLRLALELRRVEDARSRARAALEMVGLAGKASHLPHQLSGGEQQRVAVARAVAHDPMMVLADEPTANLDSANGRQVAGLLAELANDPNRIVVVVTHDPRVLPLAGHIVRLEDGSVMEDRRCDA